MYTPQVTPAVPAIVYEQFKQIRDAGHVNMLDISGVLCQAHNADFHDLVAHIGALQLLSRSERGRAYMTFLEGFQG